MNERAFFVSEEHKTCIIWSIIDSVGCERRRIVSVDDNKSILLFQRCPTLVGGGPSTMLRLLNWRGEDLAVHRQNIGQKVQFINSIHFAVLHGSVSQSSSLTNINQLGKGSHQSSERSLGIKEKECSTVSD